MKRTAPYWETPLDLFKLLMTGLGIVLLMGMLRGCVPGGPESASTAVDAPAGELGIEAPGLDLAAIPDADLAQVAEGGYELGGVALPGSEVEIFDGDVSLGMAKAGPDGKWAFALPALAAGAHALRLVGPDMDGNPFELSMPSFSLPGADADADGDGDAESAEGEGAAAEDDGEGAGEEAEAGGDADAAEMAAVAPAIDLPDLGSSFAAADLATFGGTAAPGATVMIYDGDTLLGSTTADDEGNWTFALTEPLGPGDYELMAVVAGRDEEASSEGWAFTIAADEAQDEDEADAAASGEAGAEEGAQDEAGAEDEESDHEQPSTLPRTGRAPLHP